MLIQYSSFNLYKKRPYLLARPFDLFFVRFLTYQFLPLLFRIKVKPEIIKVRVVCWNLCHRFVFALFWFKCMNYFLSRKSLF